MRKAMTAGLVGLATLAGAKAYTALDLDLPDLETTRDFILQVAAADAEEGDESAQVEGEPAPAEAAENIADPATEEARTSSVLPELLLDLSAERRAMEERRTGLNEREAELKLYEASLAKRRDALIVLRDELDSRLVATNEEHAQDLERLVRIYTSMKPDQAAGIMNDSDLEVSVMVMSAMSERSSGPILAMMNPVRARAISKIIFERSRLPADQKLIGLQID